MIADTKSSEAPATRTKPRWKDKLPLWLRYVIPYSRYLYRQLRFQWTVKSQIPAADLYYIHYFDMFPAVQALARWQGSAIIYDAHDFHSGLKPIETLSTLERKFIKPWQKRIETRCVQGSQSVVTVCDGLATLMNETFSRQVAVIRNCHDARLDNYNGPSIRQKLKLSSTDRLLVTIGNAKDCMAFRQIFEALQHLPENIHLAFLGNGYAAHLTGSHYEAVRHRVHVPGAVNPYEIVPFVREADAALILYFPHSVNSYHCLPNGFFQSVAAGLPLLYPPLPEISRIASQYQLGIPIDSLDSASIEEGIKQLFRNTATLQAFKRNCLLANDALSWQREEKVLKQLVEATLSSKEQKN